MKIIVLGDAFIDRYHVGSTSRVSPEVPVPVVEIDYTLDYPGGAMNVRENLRNLGEEGLYLFKPLDSIQNYPIKNRLICDGVQISRWDERDWCEAYQREDLLPLLDADAIVVSDYGKGSITKEVIQILRETSLPLFVDTKDDPGEWIGSNAVLFPNLKEYNQYQEKYSWFPNVILKQGEQGLSLVQYGSIVLSRSSKARFVKNVTGAGDTVMAAFIVSALAGANVDWCLEIANSAAAISVENPFTYAPMLQEVLDRQTEEMN